MAPLDSPSPGSAEGVTSSEDIKDPMNSGGLQLSTEPRYILVMGCNLTTVQKSEVAEVDALAKKIRPGIPFYTTKYHQHKSNNIGGYRLKGC